MIRQIICFIVAAALCAGGLYFLYDEAFVAGGLNFRVIAMGLFLAVVGGYWLWIDFGAPLLRRMGVKVDPPTR